MILMKLHDSKAGMQQQQQQRLAVLFWHNKTVSWHKGEQIAPTRQKGSHASRKPEVFSLSLSLILSLSLVGYSRLFPKKESCSKKRDAMDSSECQWESSELFMLPVDLGTPRYTPISPAPGPRQPLTCLPFQHKMETVPKVPIKISICDVCAEKKE